MSYGKIWLISPNGSSRVLDEGLRTSVLALSPDGHWLAASEDATRWIYSYRVSRDGSLHDKQRFYRLQMTEMDKGSEAEALAFDRAGHLYAATPVGVQVFDRQGRLSAILPVPGGEVLGLAFGGADFRTLYVSCSNHKIYKRSLNTAGMPPAYAPVKVTDDGE
jgi:gluconolactonase